MTIQHKGIDYVFSVLKENPRPAKPDIGWNRAKTGYWNLRCDYAGKWCQIAVEIPSKLTSGYLKDQASRIIDRFVADNPKTDREFWQSQVADISNLLK